MSGVRGLAGQKGLKYGLVGTDDYSGANTRTPRSEQDQNSAGQYNMGASRAPTKLHTTTKANPSVKPLAPPRQSSLPLTSAPRPGSSRASALGLSFSGSATNMMAESAASSSVEPYMAPLQSSENLPVPSQAFSQSLTPPTPLYTLSTTPSTFCSDSPGPFSHSSTPTSMSSHSPGVVFPARFFHRNKDDSPSRNGPSNLLVGQRTEDLSHQSYNSSSSNSTIKAGERDSSRQRHFSAQLQNTLQSSDRSANPSPMEASSAVETKVKTPNNDASVEKARVPEMHSTGLAQAPPELAHLATATPQLLHGRVPSRPSREGTTVLDLREPSPVIQSNMSRLPISHHRRTSSSDSRISGPSLTTSPRGLKLMKPGHKLPANSSDLNLSNMKVSTSRRPSTQDSDADKPTSGRGRAKLRKEATAPSPQPTSSNKHSSRLGFLSRSRKGPAAGTGHEGYGKYSLRRRSGSNAGNGTGGRSPSADSIASSSYGYSPSRKSSMSSEREEPSMDCFLRERLSPVVIRGEGTAARISDSSASQDGWKGKGVLGGWSTVASSVTSLESTASAAKDASNLTLLPSAMAREQTTFPESDYRARQAGQDAYIESDAPVSPKTVEHPVSTSSKNKGKTQWPVLEMTTSKEPESFTDMSQKATKERQSRVKPLHKWNFFQRAQTRTNNNSSKGAPLDEHADPDSPVSVARFQPARTVPHYAMLEMPQSVDMQDLEQLMQEADVSQEESTSLAMLDDDVKEVNDGQFHHNLTKDESKEKKIRNEHVESVLLPSPPSLMTTFSHLRNGHSEISNSHYQKTEEFSNEACPSTASDLDAVSAEQQSGTAEDSVIATPDLNSASPGKTSRLAQIGRIPKVVSKRDRERKLPIQSFSRPFAPSQPRPQLQPPVSSSTPNGLQRNEGAQGIAQRQIANDGKQEQQSMEDYALGHSNNSRPIVPLAQDTEFLSFPPRKDSDISYTSSSGGCSTFSSAAVALQNGSVNGLFEDEVWKEYDDLLDEVAISKPTSSKAMVSSTSSLPAVSSKSTNRSRRRRKGKKNAASKLDGSRLGPNDINVAKARTAVDDSEVASLSCAGSWCGSDVTPSRKTKLLSGSSSIIPAAGISPGTPMSVTDLLATYEDRNRSGDETEFESEDDKNDNARMCKAMKGSKLGEENASCQKKRISLLTHSTSYSHVAGSGTTGATTVSDQGTSLTSITPSSVPAVAVTNDTDSASTAEVAANSHVVAKYPDPKSIEEVENRNDGLVSMANLRFGALMTSKWLSFGQVLFSPVQAELAQSTGERILVLDGLGTGKSLSIF